MIDISGFGTGITIIAINSFPMGVPVSQFADDKDPIVITPMETVGWKMLYDGSLFQYAKADPIRVSISVIAGSEDDINLKLLLQGSLASAGVLPLPNTTSMVLNYPVGYVMLSNGTIYRGPIADTVQASGRKAGNTYDFAFGSFFGAQSSLEAITQLATSALSSLNSSALNL
jgi:hypothetical protein